MPPTAPPGLKQAIPSRPASISGLPTSSSLPVEPDRKSTRLNSSHSQISYAVFCLKKKKIVCLVGQSAVDKRKHSRDYLPAAFPGCQPGARAQTVASYASRLAADVACPTVSPTAIL